MSKTISRILYLVSPCFIAIVLLSCNSPNDVPIDDNPSVWQNFTNGNNITSLAVLADTMWVGTTGGLAKVQMTSGTLLKFFTKVNSDLPENSIKAVASDLGRGGVWIGLENNGITYLKGDTWTAYNTGNSDMPHNSVQCLTMDGSGNNIAIGTEGGGLALFNGSTTWTIHSTQNGAPSNSIYAIAIEQGGDIWIGTDAGLGRMSGGSWQTYTTANSDLPRNFIISLSVGSPGNVIVGTLGKGLVIFDKSTSWIVYNSDTTGGKLPDDNITCLTFDQKGTLWVGTEYGGAAKYDSSGWTTITAGGMSGLPSNRVRAIAADAQNTLWIGTEQGLLKYGAGTINTSVSPLPSNHIKSIVIDNDGNPWIGTDQGAAVKMGDTWKVYDTSNSGLQTPMVNAIAIASNNDKWFATGSFTNGNVAVLSGSTWTSHDTAGMQLPTLHVQNIFIDGNLFWIGTEAGLVKTDGASSWTTYTTDNADLPMNGITAIAKDSKGDLWLGCSEYYHNSAEGVAQFSGGKAINTYNEYDTELPHNFIHDILVDPNDNKWIGTENGLAKLDAADSTWSVYSSTNSDLPGNKTFSLVLESATVLWVGTDKGLASLTLSSGTWKVYTSLTTGLPSDKIKAIAFDSEGNQWIGTENGLAVRLYKQDEIIVYK